LWSLTKGFTAERNKRAGTLPPFDPTGHYVHPRSRIRHTIIINPKRAFAKNPALKSVARDGGKKAVSVYDDSELSEPLDSEDEDQDANDDDDYGARPRRSSRAAKKPVKTLPFSPKKKRARKGFVVPDSDVEDEDDGESEIEIEEVMPTRRSSRSTKNAKAKYAEDEYMDDEGEQHESDSDDDDVGDGKPRKSRKGRAQKTKKIVRGKASRPAYGNVRHVADLDYDGLSDEETAALRAHRDVCEKCHRGPAHDLIVAASKKPKGKGRKKKDEDMDDFEGDEMERLTALGGWVRW
jgi:chromodomain-helicase-DNA-binding protein 4